MAAYVIVDSDISPPSRQDMKPTPVPFAQPILRSAVQPQSPGKSSKLLRVALSRMGSAAWYSVELYQVRAASLFGNSMGAAAENVAYCIRGWPVLLYILVITNGDLMTESYSPDNVWTPFGAFSMVVRRIRSRL